MHKLVNTLFDANLLKSFVKAVMHVFSDSDSLDAFVILTDASTYQTLAIDKSYQVALPHYLKALKSEGELGIFTLEFIKKVKEDESEDDLAIKRFLEKFNSYITTDDQDDIIGLNNNHFQSMLFSDTDLPFLDRTDFRDKFYEAMHCQKGEVIFVDGEGQSGMSYLKEYFLDICNKFDFLEFGEINAGLQLDAPAAVNGQGVYLAKVMAANFLLNIDLEIEDIEDLKFIRFSELLRTKFSEMDKIPLVFIHDFHKVTNLLSDVTNFLYELLTRVVETFPRAIFVVAGFPYKNLSEWDSSLSYKCEVYKMENIGEEDLTNFANTVYNKYEEQIKKMYGNEHDKFQEAFVKRLLPLSQDSISKLAQVIKSDLKKIKDYV